MDRFGVAFCELIHLITHSKKRNRKNPLAIILPSDEVEEQISRSNLKYALQSYTVEWKFVKLFRLKKSPDVHKCIKWIEKSFDPNYNRPVRYDPNYPNSYHHSPRAAMMHNPHSRFQRMDSPYQQMHPSPRGHYGPSPGHRPNMPSSMGGVQQMRPMSHQSGYNDQIVLLVNNLNPEKMNCDYLFNFLCVYGNVYRIKFLRSREGCAMAQMNQSEALTVFLRQINNTYLFGSKLSISISKQEYLEPVIKPFTLPDGSLYYMDYENSRNKCHQLSLNI
ncbi:hypothetical protein GJ496_005483 [Pomphorhynchus laevis]|nr:hypothetical protein GJ496_005483 [Pomphorhynchus laevis]